MIKVQLGCGQNVRKDWINCDKSFNMWLRRATRKYYRRIDLSKAFPFEDNSIDYIYNEDFIEHFDQATGMLILVECHRTLKQNGALRISTPNLAYWLTPEKMKERNGSCDSYSGFLALVKTHWRQWGHKLLYTPQLLKEALTFTGFREIVMCNYSESNIEAFKNIDSRIDQKDSNIYLEAVKR
jgi:hypothetical protein